MESATETLSEYLERDITSENLADIKQKVQDKYRYNSLDFLFQMLIIFFFFFCLAQKYFCLLSCSILCFLGYSGKNSNSIVCCRGWKSGGTYYGWAQSKIASENVRILKDEDGGGIQIADPLFK